MNVQKEERVEDSLERLMGDEVKNSWRLVWQDSRTMFRKLIIVCCERARKKKYLLEKNILTNKCLLREKDNILNLLEEENVWKNRNILMY